MRLYPYPLILPLFLLLAALWSCCAHKGTNSSSTTNDPLVHTDRSNAAKTNVEELGLLVNVPYEVDDVVWKEDTINRKVLAVLHFAKADAERIISDAAAKKPPQQVTLQSESWFPGELIAQSEMSGEEGLRGTAYAADEFYMEPYVSGQIVRINQTDYFVLQLSAK